MHSDMSNFLKIVNKPKSIKNLKSKNRRKSIICSPELIAEKNRPVAYSSFAVRPGSASTWSRGQEGRQGHGDVQSSGDAGAATTSFSSAGDVNDASTSAARSLWSNGRRAFQGRGRPGQPAITL